MSINNRKPENLTKGELKQQSENNRGWYFITFVRDLPHNRPYGFTLYNEPFVLLKKKNGQLICYLLPLLEEENNSCVTSVPIVEKQEMIWLWYRKDRIMDESLIPTINNF